jgi:hypothetical protein
MFGPFGVFPRFGFGGILPSYIPYLVASGFGRCHCPNPLQNLPAFVFTGVIPSPFILRW